MLSAFNAFLLCAHAPLESPEFSGLVTIVRLPKRLIRFHLSADASSSASPLISSPSESTSGQYVSQACGIRCSSESAVASSGTSVLLEYRLASTAARAITRRGWDTVP